MASYSETVLGDNPLVYLRMEETTGTTLTDSSGNGHDGTAIDGPTLGVAGAVGNGAQFAGTADQRISLGTGPAVMPTKGSWEAFVRPFDRGPSFASRPFIGKRGANGGSNNGFRIVVTGDTGHVRVFAAISTGSSATFDVNFTAAPTVPLNEWTHIVVTFGYDAGANQSVLRLYMNGEPVGNPRTWTGNWDVGTRDTTYPLTVGSAGTNSNERWNGVLDEVAIYDYALTPEQVAAHYGARNNPEVPPVETYTLTSAVEGEGSVLLDPPGGVYAEGVDVTAAAIPSEGWVFSHWTGALTGSVQTQTVEMLTDHAITAHFIPDPAGTTTLLALQRKVGGVWVAA